MGKKNNKKNQTGIAIACWLLGFLVLIIVFFVKQDEIIQNLKDAQFFENVFNVSPEFLEKHSDENHKKTNRDSDAEKDEPQQIQIQIEETASNHDERIAPKSETPAVENSFTAEKNDAEKLPATKPEKETDAVKTAEEKNPPKQEITAPPVKTVTRKIYFVFIGEDGSVSRKTVERTTERNDSPLVTSINLLLAGPSAAETAKGCKTLIPDAVQLKSASVRDGIAYLNFNEEFEFNPVGVDGYFGQLMQIVYTATEFSTVKGVQFLIEGEKKEYLGSEGIWIGSPLSRGSF